MPGKITRKEIEIFQDMFELNDFDYVWKIGIGVQFKFDKRSV
jgi:hypothetical protein